MTKLLPMKVYPFFLINIKTCLPEIWSSVFVICCLSVLNYRNNSIKNRTPEVITLHVIIWFSSAVERLNDADGMANNEDPDQTAPQEQSDLGLQCLLSLISPNI